MSIRLCLLSFLCFLLGMGAMTCSLGGKETSSPIGPNAPASLIIYFKVGVTEEQINTFSQQVLSTPHPQGRGRNLREGIGLQLRVFPSVQGHEAIALTFLADAEQSQREEIKSAVLASPIVYKVLENRAPSDVKSLE